MCKAQEDYLTSACMLDPYEGVSVRSRVAYLKGEFLYWSFDLYTVHERFWYASQV